MSTLELARTGAAESKTNTFVLVQPVDLVEKSRHLLDFIDNHKFLSTRSEFLSQIFWVRGKSPVDIRFKQIHPFHTRVGLFQQSAFARLTRPPKEKYFRPV
jgi:hypothetical protein